MEKTKTEILAEEILLKAKSNLTENIHSACQKHLLFGEKQTQLTVYFEINYVIYQF